jgi:hypothetical protein
MKKPVEFTLPIEDSHTPGPKVPMYELRGGTFRINLPTGMRLRDNGDETYTVVPKIQYGEVSVLPDDFDPSEVMINATIYQRVKEERDGLKAQVEMLLYHVNFMPEKENPTIKEIKINARKRLAQMRSQDGGEKK